MYGFIRSDMPEKRQSACKFWLLLLWCAGLILGVFFACQADDSTILMMRSAASAPVSISGLLVVFLLPFLLSASAVYLSQPLLLLATAFAKAFSFGFCAYAVDSAFRSAGWLMCLLLMFSDLCFLPVLMWFWLRHITGNRRSADVDLAVCAAIAVCIGLFDYCIVSPFLAMVL